MRIKNVLFFLALGIVCTAGRYGLDRLSASRSTMPGDFRDAPADVKPSHDDDSWFMILSPSHKAPKKEEKKKDSAVADAGPSGAFLVAGSVGPMGYSYAVPSPFSGPDRASYRR